jgi:very-short-patch-repair endonuclease
MLTGWAGSTDIVTVNPDHPSGEWSPSSTDVIGRNNGHRGRGAPARATAQEPKLTRSELEQRFLALVRKAGLPEPLSNHVLADLDHQRHEVDFSFPTHNLVVETDGWDTHKTRAAFQSDRRKDAALTSAGCRVMRFTSDDIVYEPDTVVARLRPRSAPA